MDKVVFDGVTYTKASKVAADFKYTADYLGQLCRARKIDARLVGRTWFVNNDSVTKHKQAKYKSTAIEIEPDSSESPVKILQDHAVVAPVVKNKTIKVVTSFNQAESIRAKKLHVSYELDDEVLIPELHRVATKPPKKLLIEAVGAKKLSIRNKKSEVNFEPSTLPDVALSGKLSITDYPKIAVELDEAEVQSTQETENNKNSFENKAISDESVAKKIHSSDILSKEKENIKEADVKEKSIVVSKGSVVSMTNNSSKVANLDTANKEIKKLPELTVTPPVEVSLLVSFSPLIAVFVALVCAAVLFSITNQIVVFESGNESKFIFQLANLLAVF